MYLNTIFISLSRVFWTPKAKQYHYTNYTDFNRDFNDKTITTRQPLQSKTSSTLDNKLKMYINSMVPISQIRESLKSRELGKIIELRKQLSESNLR